MADHEQFALLKRHIADLEARAQAAEATIAAVRRLCLELRDNAYTVGDMREGEVVVHKERIVALLEATMSENDRKIIADMQRDLAATHAARPEVEKRAAVVAETFLRAHMGARWSGHDLVNLSACLARFAEEQVLVSRVPAASANAAREGEKP